MDNVTHSLFALTLARTRVGRAGAGTTAALLIASNAPDCDIVKAMTDSGAAYLTVHRGPTHGPIGIAALGVATAAIVKLFVPRAHLGRLTAVSCLAALLHVVMDLPTSYGTRWLSPLESSWYALDLMPIIDVYLLGLLAVGLTVARLSPARATRVATVVLALMGCNYVLRATTHQIAVSKALAASGETTECDGGLFARWSPDPDGAAPDPHCVAALPTFTSPFTWRLVHKTPGLYEIRDLSVFRGPTGEPVRTPDEHNDWVDRARKAPMARVLLHFSRFPAARVEHDRAGGVTIYWNDMRFAGDIATVGDTRPQVRSAFSAAVQLDEHGRIIAESLAGGRFSRSAD